MIFIRIAYWPVKRTYSTPNKLQAVAPDKWRRMSDGAREKWARDRLCRELPGSTYVGWSKSNG